MRWEERNERRGKVDLEPSDRQSKLLNQAENSGETSRGSTAPNSSAKVDVKARRNSSHTVQPKRNQENNRRKFPSPKRRGSDQGVRGEAQKDCARQRHGAVSRHEGPPLLSRPSQTKERRGGSRYGRPLFMLVGFEGGR